MKSTKVRQAIASIVVIALIIVFAAIATGIFGWNIPILRDIAAAMGVGPQ